MGALLSLCTVGQVSKFVLDSNSLSSILLPLLKTSNLPLDTILTSIHVLPNMLSHQSYSWPAVVQAQLAV